MSESYSISPIEAELPIEPKRRRFLAGAAAAGAAALLAGTGRAFATTHQHHTWAYGGLMHASEACLAKGHACLNHCINTLKAGDTSLAMCAVAVQETIAACGALGQLSAANSVHTKAFADACAAVCADCETECRKHAAKHEACAQCADACAALVREAKGAKPA